MTIARDIREIWTMHASQPAAQKRYSVQINLRRASNALQLDVEMLDRKTFATSVPGMLTSPADRKTGKIQANFARDTRMLFRCFSLRFRLRPQNVLQKAHCKPTHCLAATRLSRRHSLRRSFSACRSSSVRRITLFSSSVGFFSSVRSVRRCRRCLTRQNIALGH